MKYTALLFWAAMSVLWFAAPASAETTFPANVYALNMADPGAEPACLNRGGSVATMETAKVCVLPKGCVANFSGMLMTTAIMDPVTPEAQKACTDTCGMISKSTTGQTFCTKPAKHGSMRTMTPGGTAPREPTN